MILFYYLLCSYNKILVKEPSNLKILGITLADIIITLLMSYFVFLIVNYFYNVNYLIVFLVMLIFGVFLQRYFCKKNIIKYIEKNYDLIINYIINMN
mgnify:CR=1 FL=1